MMYHVYAGGYTASGGAGLYRLTLDGDRGRLRLEEEIPCENPSFLAVSDRHVYAITGRRNPGQISACLRDPETGKLTFQNRVTTEGGNLCHLLLWPDGRHLSAACYGTGSLEVWSLTPDGALDRLCFSDTHRGRGADPVRQEKPHIHSTALTGRGELYAADLGLDWVACYEPDKDGSFCLTERGIRTPPGTGPRHMTFSEDGDRLYLVTEMGNSLLVYGREEREWKLLQELSVLPPDAADGCAAADLHFSPDRRFLYVSVRGADCLSLFRAGPAGTLEPAGFCPVYGRGPRNFCVLEEFLLTANYEDGGLVLSGRNRDTGLCGPVLDRIPIPTAAFVTAVAEK